MATVTWVKGKTMAMIRIPIERRDDLVRVVRCKDCMWHEDDECLYEHYFDEYDSVGNNIPMHDEDFCSRGERRDDG